MRVFVAGGTGVIGRSLVPRLVADGHEVTAMTRSADGSALLRSLGAKPVMADALDRDSVLESVVQTRPDAIINQLTDLRAGNGVANAALRIEGTRNLVDAAHAAGVARIIAQSVAWAYVPGDEPADEQVLLDVAAAEPRATTVRGVTALELAVREVPQWIVLRYGVLYGSGTWYAAEGLRADEARAGHLVANEDVTSFVQVGDAALAAVQALDWPSGAVNVCDDDPAPGIEWVPVFCVAVDAPVPPLAGVGRAPWARGADNARAREELGWSPHYASWRDGFQIEN